MTPDEIDNKQFTVVRLTEAGYRQSEVDDFLEAIKAEWVKALAALEAATVRAQSRAAADSIMIEPAPPVVTPVAPERPSVHTIALLLSAAEDVASRLRRDAETDVEKIRADANSAARTMIAEVREKSDELTRKALDEKDKILAELDVKRIELEDKVANLRGKHSAVVTLFENLLDKAKTLEK